VALPLLRRYLRPQLSGLYILARDPGNTFLPEADINAGALPQGCSQRHVVISCGDAEPEQGIGPIGLDLRGEHAGSRPPRLAVVAARLEDEHAASGSRELSGAGGSNGAAANYDHVMGGRHGDL
jgi:hypothetical protein